MAAIRCVLMPPQGEGSGHNGGFTLQLKPNLGIIWFQMFHHYLPCRTWLDSYFASRVTLGFRP